MLKWNKSEKDKSPWYNLHVNSKKYNKLVNNTKEADSKDTENNQAAPVGRGGRRGGNIGNMWLGDYI